MPILKRLEKITSAYPRQFWLLFWGMLVSFVGMSMVFPFLVVFIRSELGLPLTWITSLITINAVMSLISSLIAGAAADLIGRKRAMVSSLAVYGITFLGLMAAGTYLQYALVMLVRGAFQPLYRVGADAMVTDLVSEEIRPDAFALIRLGRNLGIALGPALGGLIASRSYAVTFLIAALVSFLFSALILIFAEETMPRLGTKKPEKFSRSLASYRGILQDREFSWFIAGFTLRQISGSILWVLLGAYAIDNFGLAENLFGLIPMTNALMVVLIQLPVTGQTKRFHPLLVMCLGTALYGLGVGSIALGTGFWGFWSSMVVMTIGELMVIPTASTYTANQAPLDRRGRYMSLLALAMGAGSMIGPLLGGVLNDLFFPRAIWIGGGLAGLLGGLVYLMLLLRRDRSRALFAV